MKPKFSIGDKVIIKSFGRKLGIIDSEPKNKSGKIFYSVSLDPNKESPFYPEDALDRYIKPKNIDSLSHSKEFINLNDFIQGLIYKKLEDPLSDNLYTFYASRTKFLVHQFKPVLKFLNSNKQRLLLADEVGLGKTIESGIILTEMSARLEELSRVLIACSLMLTVKWESEMQKRFGLIFNIHDRNSIRKFLSKYNEYRESERLGKHN